MGQSAGLGVGVPSPPVDGEQYPAPPMPVHMDADASAASAVVDGPLTPRALPTHPQATPSSQATLPRGVPTTPDTVQVGLPELQGGLHLPASPGLDKRGPSASAVPDAMLASQARPPAHTSQPMHSKPPQPLMTMYRPRPPREIMWHELQNVTLLKHGSGSTLFTGWLDGESVVIKAPKHGLSPSEIAEVTRELQHESEVLARLRHPNIIRFYGCGTVALDEHTIVFFIVVEHLDGGILSERLKLNRTTPQMTFLDVLRFSYQLAEALHYLHHLADIATITIHRDLKPDNVGFTADGTLKLFDFGLSTRIPRQQGPSGNGLMRYQLTGQTGSVRYMAPEVALDQPYNQSVDTYSFSIILWEAMHQRKPFQGLNVETHRRVVCVEGQRLPIDGSRPPTLVALLRECWDAEPTKRPSFSNISARLQAMLQAAEAAGGSVRPAGQPMSIKDRLMRRRQAQGSSSSWF